MANILQVSNIRNSTAKTSNRFTLRFNGLDVVLDRAKTSPLAAVRERYANLESAMLKEGFGLSQTLELSLLSATLPPMEKEMATAWRFHDSAKHIVRFAEMADLSTVFYDYIRGSSAAIMFAWDALTAERKTGAIGFREDYVLPKAELLEFGPIAPGEETPTPVAEYEIINLFPKTIDIGDSSYESAELRKITVAFACDAVYAKKAIGEIPRL